MRETAAPPPTEHLQYIGDDVIKQTPNAHIIDDYITRRHEEGAPLPFLDGIYNTDRAEFKPDIDVIGLITEQYVATLNELADMAGVSIPRYELRQRHNVLERRVARVTGVSCVVDFESGTYTLNPSPGYEDLVTVARDAFVAQAEQLQRHYSKLTSTGEPFYYPADIRHPGQFVLGTTSDDQEPNLWLVDVDPDIRYYEPGFEQCQLPLDTFTESLRAMANPDNYNS